MFYLLLTNFLTCISFCWVVEHRSLFLKVLRYSHILYNPFDLYTHTETILSGFEQWSFLRKDLKHMWMNLWDCKPMTFQTRVDNAQFFLCFIAQGSPLFLFFWCTFRPFQICNLVIESSLSSSTLTWMIITDKDNFKFAQLEIFGFQLLPTLRSEDAKTKTRSLGTE